MTILISTETKPPQESDELYNLKTPTQTKPLSYPFLYVITRTLLHTHTHIWHTLTHLASTSFQILYMPGLYSVYCQFILKNFVFFTPFFFPIHSFSFPFVFSLFLFSFLFALFLSLPLFLFFLFYNLKTFPNDLKKSLTLEGG